MKTGRIFGWLLACVVCALCIASSAMADGSSRLATAAERAFYSRVMETIQKALPSPPVGWEITFQTETDAPQRVAVGLEKHPYSLTYNAEWVNAPARDKMERQRRELMQEAASGAVTNSGDEALIKQIEVLTAQAADAAQSGNYAEAQKIQKQMEPLVAKLQDSMEEKTCGVDQMLADTAVRDIGASILVSVNSYGFAAGGQIERISPVAGNDKVFREPGEEHYTGEISEHGVTTVLLGQGWKEARDGENVHYEAPENLSAPHTTAYTIMVEVQADQERSAAIIKAIDWNLLKTLLAQ